MSTVSSLFTSFLPFSFSLCSFLPSYPLNEYTSMWRSEVSLSVFLNWFSTLPCCDIETFDEPGNHWLVRLTGQWAPRRIRLLHLHGAGTSSMHHHACLFPMGSAVLETDLHVCMARSLPTMPCPQHGSNFMRSCIAWTTLKPHSHGSITLGCVVD